MTDVPEVTINIPSDIQSSTKFADLPLAPMLLDSLSKQNIEYMTKVQDLAIPHILAGSDVAVKAKTGSGKSIAFLLPALDLIYRAQMKPRNGTGVIVMSPTRELALQLYKVAKELAQDRIQIGLAVGGTSLQKETEKLAKGCSLVIATPGRLRDHIANSIGFKFSHLFLIIFDEADLLLDLGFEEEISQLLDVLPNAETRQTALFSATLSDRVLKLKNLVLKENLVKLDADEHSTFTTRVNFTQGYIVCPPDLKFLLLYTFIKKNKNQKIIVFMSTCASVEFYSNFLRYINLDDVHCIYGKLKQAQRTNVAEQFSKAESGVLIATNVAARGLDIPDVDYIIQFDPPDSIESYVHRAGRACRGTTSRKGTGILFLSETETGFVKMLSEIGLVLSEFEFPTKKIINVQEEMEKTVSTNYNLATLAQAAFRDCCLAYANHSLRKIFDIAKLEVEKLSKSYGLRVMPRIDAIIGRQRKEMKDRKYGQKDKKEK
ncbi:ATP-dependent_RNA helicase HAS1 [Hexamita inflata]|uniref:ATP-dependent RNA helicase n=1 Tax=Hexamita inflata TaxID=28002 RepID=A0AA86UZE3_9EUKA|nr:ATP-dependent RNA helicase HAS1 [Hexamita inflata]